MPLSNVQPEHYNSLLHSKADLLREPFSRFTTIEPAIFPSSPNHYRMRAEFRIKHIDNEPHYVMFRKDSPKEAHIIETFKVACPAIADVMQPLRELIAASEELKRRLFQVDFLSGLCGELLVTLIYHRPLGDEWLAEAASLAKQLPVKIIGRSRKQKLVLDRDYIIETLEADGHSYPFRHYENSFTQPNARVNEAMISWACTQVKQSTSDLLELYCGCGNFTIPLSRYFENVLATEVSKSSVHAAQENCELNGVSNIDVVRLSAEEISAALKGVRPFRRLAHLQLDDFNLNTVFVDPPRAGLDDFTRDMVSEFDQILYISCNPQTLLRDLEHLCQNHHIKSLAFFDQFPYTSHMECGVFLQKESI
ncbi:MAG: tRNA (uracil-5-)-methyltransferase [Bermanella sp.]|jgi:tRNA (uracil-5-)-methyltransferase